MLDIETGDWDENSFAILTWIDFNNVHRGGKIVINSLQRVYEYRIVSAIVHEVIHWSILKLEGISVSRRLDHLFPTIYDSECFIDCFMERHILWRKKFDL